MTVTFTTEAPNIPMVAQARRMLDRIIKIKAGS